MQVRKTYRGVQPELLYGEVNDFILKQGAGKGESSIETYSLPSDSSSFVSRGTLTFKCMGKGNAEGECIRAHIVGQAKGETKLMLDIDVGLFPKDRVQALEADLDFIFGSYEVKPD